eukprot:1143418-Pelagomonas_calceolata.AAC.6
MSTCGYGNQSSIRTAGEVKPGGRKEKGNYEEGREEHSAHRLWKTGHPLPGQGTTGNPSTERRKQSMGIRT